MRNDMAVSRLEAEDVEDVPVADVPAPTPASPAPLVILPTDDAVSCVVDLCLPPVVER